VSYASLLVWATGELAAQSATAHLDAELLLEAATGAPRSRLFGFPETPVMPAARQRFERDVSERRAGVPIAYLTGCKEFFSLSLKVTRDVLVPRPETELLVEQALERLPADRPARVLDVGTGSGAIALAVKQMRPQASVTALEMSSAALDVARENGRTLGLAVDWRHSNWFAALAAHERFELILSNPPYVASDDPHFSGPLRMEPRLALDGGAQGLAALRLILAEARRHLDAAGWLLLEHGATQRAELEWLARAAGFNLVAGYADLAGLDRVLALQAAR
jgi:release factor glutamine methyltransferase